jgi:magnesium transporter
MITVYRSTPRGLEALDQPVPGAWVTAVNPSPGEVARLQQEYGVPEAFVASSLDIDERSRTDRENGAQLIVLKVPFFQGDKEDVPYRTVTLGIVLVGEYIITISRQTLSLIEGIQSSRPGLISTAKRNRLILHILLATAQMYLMCLQQINSKTEAVEDRLQRSLRNQEVLELLKYQKSLVYFTTGLKTNELLLQRVQRSQLFQAYPEDQDLLDDVLTENTQAIEMINISSSILSQMMDAFASIISNNLNIVMKFLAAATIILSFPTMVASIYGMNIKLPLQDEPLAFIAVMGTAIAISLIVTIILWRRDWL